MYQEVTHYVRSKKFSSPTYQGRLNHADNTCPCILLPDCLIKNSVRYWHRSRRYYWFKIDSPVDIIGRRPITRIVRNDAVLLHLARHIDNEGERENLSHYKFWKPQLINSIFFSKSFHLFQLFVIFAPFFQQILRSS